MLFYRVYCNGDIDKKEVLRVTSKMVFLANGKQESKECSWHKYFSSLPMAKLHAVHVIDKNYDDAKRVFTFKTEYYNDQRVKIEHYTGEES